jgi:hypothetical protein
MDVEPTPYVGDRNRRRFHCRRLSPPGARRRVVDAARAIRESTDLDGGAGRPAVLLDEAKQPRRETARHLISRAWPGLGQADARRCCPSRQQPARRRGAGAVPQEDALTRNGTDNRIRPRVPPKTDDSFGDTALT